MTGTNVPTVLPCLGQSGLGFSSIQSLAIARYKIPSFRSIHPPHYPSRNSENSIAGKRVHTGMAYFCPRVSVRLGGWVMVSIEAVVVKFVVVDCR